MARLNQMRSARSLRGRAPQDIDVGDSSADERESAGRPSEGDERKPRKPDGTPKGGGPYARDFGVPEDTAQESFTDPDSRIMKHANGGFDQSYNGQTAVDAENGIVIAAERVQCAADSGELAAMLGTVRANLGAAPEQTLADAGYRDEAVFAALAEGDTELIVSLGREVGTIDAVNKPHTAAMAERLQSEEGRAAYRRRKGIVEPPNGWIKHVMGFRQFSLRGVGKVRAEWKLVNAALNLRRMAYL